jgi:hypothetical protein
MQGYHRSGDLGMEAKPLYSSTLHILVRRASTSWVTSFTILAFVFGDIVVNHFASRTFPCLETSKT